MNGLPSALPPDAPKLAFCEVIFDTLRESFSQDFVGVGYAEALGD